MSDIPRLQRQTGQAGVVAIFAIFVIVLILLLVWYGFFGPGHWFGTGGGNTVNVTVQGSP